MDYREQALTEIANRIKRDRDVLELKTFRWNNNNTSDKEEVPIVYMFEGDDKIINHSNRNKIGYPARRELEVEMEIVVKKDKTLLKSIYKKLRRAIFCEREDSENLIIWKPNNVVAKNCFIVEKRIKGPGTYEIPELIGIKMTLGLSYTDNGIEDLSKIIE